jgi:hypothetical protein
VPEEARQEADAQVQDLLDEQPQLGELGVALHCLSGWINLVEVLLEIPMNKQMVLQFKENWLFAIP